MSEIAPPATPAAPPSVQPAPVPVAPPSGPGPSDWRAALPPDLQADKTLEKFKDQMAVNRAYVELEKYRGRSVAIPGPDAKPEERDAFLAKLGRPETPEKYTLPLPEDADQALVGDFKQAAHRLGLTQDQVAGLTSWFGSSPMGNPVLASEAMQAKAIETLRAEWGGAYDYNLKAANAGVGYAERMGGTAGLRDLLDKSGMGNHPLVVKHFKWVYASHAESGGIPRDATTGGVMTPEDAQTRINELRQTPEYRRGDRAVTDEVQRLYQLKTQG